MKCSVKGFVFGQLWDVIRPSYLFCKDCFHCHIFFNLTVCKFAYFCLKTPCSATTHSSDAHYISFSPSTLLLKYFIPSLFPLSFSDILLNISPPAPVWQSMTSTGKERSEEIIDRGPNERRRCARGYRSYTPQRQAVAHSHERHVFQEHQGDHRTLTRGWRDNVTTSNLFPTSDLNVSHYIKQQALEHEAACGCLRGSDKMGK